jgi:glycosyltransferase involved in cell wall biosynthesis
MLPHFLAHYSGFDHVYVCDNGSTDDSLLHLERYANVSRLDFDTRGRYREAEQSAYKNRVWKQSRGLADFVIVCDVDEFLYHPDLPGVLQNLKARGVSVLVPSAYQMVSKTTPNVGDNLLMKYRFGVRHHVYDKSVLFDPNAIDEINFGLGAHICRPKGRVVYDRVAGVALLHYKFVGYDYVWKRYRAYTARTTRADMGRGYNPHHRIQAHELRQQFRELTARQVDVLDHVDDVVRASAKPVPAATLARRYRRGLRAFRERFYADAAGELLKISQSVADRLALGAALAGVLQHCGMAYEFTYAFHRAEAIAASAMDRRTVLLKMAAFYRRMRHLELSEHALRYLLELYPDDTAARLRLAQVLHRLGRPRLAIQECQAVLALQPRNDFARQYAVMLREQFGIPLGARVSQPASEREGGV